MLCDWAWFNFFFKQIGRFEFQWRFNIRSVFQAGNTAPISTPHAKTLYWIANDIVRPGGPRGDFYRTPHLIATQTTVRKSMEQLTMSASEQTFDKSVLEKYLRKNLKGFPDGPEELVIREFT